MLRKVGWWKSRWAAAPLIRTKSTVTLPKEYASSRYLASAKEYLQPTDQFLNRHLGISRESEVKKMLSVIGSDSIDCLIEKTIPENIRLQPNNSFDTLDLEPMSETEALRKLEKLASKNKVQKSMIGMGYYDCITPGVIQRNILENPGWYTAYTPYQAEVSQGRLESLLNFQTMVSDLTGLPVANASLLDEGTAAAEAMTLCHGAFNGKRTKFFVAEDCHPQTIGVIDTRADGFGIEIVKGNPHDVDFSSKEFSGLLLQYPNTYGRVSDPSDIIARAREHGTLAVVATDLMALTQLKPPGEFGADIAVGSAQRFGVPLMFGGPHAAFFATNEKYHRKIPGRLIGVSVDSRGKPALRMAMQTREQHIRRDKATSNICTAQALLANMAANYGVYHGPEGLHAIGERLHRLARTFALGVIRAGCTVKSSSFFDTVEVDVSTAGMSTAEVHDAAVDLGFNIRIIDALRVGVSMGESITKSDIATLLQAFGAGKADVERITDEAQDSVQFVVPEALLRSTPYMTHPVFNSHRSETQMLRYLKYLESKDLSLNTSMISLGSCTMKLNATSELVPVSWKSFTNIHPFAPKDQCAGYLEMIQTLNDALAKITGFAAISTQPNSGAQGEYAGLMCIKKYHEANGDHHRNVCLIPVSAHGTNPASAVMAGMKVVVVKSDADGNIDYEDLQSKAEKHKENLSAFMITYPSTYGVFEEGVKEMCALIHAHGGQVYMDGANMNAQVGLCNPYEIGADVCHLNLHKTFTIPHGGGGPGVGTIGVSEHLAPYLPGNSVVPTSGEGVAVRPKTTLAVSSAPFGSAGILPIPWMYIHMLGREGLRTATKHAILGANYMAKRLENSYDIVFTGKNGTCAHEFIIDIRPFKKIGVVEEDVAKRLQDYGFHSPTMSWPVAGTLMIEPTESEDLAELDRFCDAMIAIRGEISAIESGQMLVEESPLKHAPHTVDMVCSDVWERKYSRRVAAFPARWQQNGAKKAFWPTVGRIDNVHGDRHLVCTCPPLESYVEDE